MKSSYTFEFNKMLTEERNPKTMDLDVLDTLDLVSRIQSEDLLVAQAVNKVIPDIARAVDLIVDGLRAGGRLIYFGAGTSGRLGVLDASECPPTFGIDPNIVTAYIAGGKEAMFQAFENAEDSKTSGIADATAANITDKDVVVGITASGRTPYVQGACDKARELGAKVIAVVNNPNSELESIADVAIVAPVGPEALTGSTRMKAGTAQKMILNLISTCSMVRLGKVYENLMVDLKPTNEKLRERALMIISSLADVPRHIAEGALVASHYNAKTAILMVKRKLGRQQAETLINKSAGFLRQALDEQA
ncbi:MAG: N-acetylmuramic acid 6-phosphate etherase [Candidatus Obscuribacterales bacterium]|nr:N-acetylmuramic acid 6-phosphate etherase [Candidatus Obscuribacterales bacterium]